MQPGFFIPTLDGIRAIAVLLVIATHCGYRFASGALGVNVFPWLRDAQASHFERLVTRPAQMNDAHVSGI